MAMKQRIEYIDIAKALLIIFLIWSHYRMISRFQEVDDSMLKWMGSIVKIFATFFMQTFFLLTGFCSSFKGQFKEYLWKNVKTILIPGIILCVLDRALYNALPGTPFEHTPSAMEWLVDGGPWFIFAMFWAKLLYWPMAHLSIKKQLAICWGGYLLVLVQEQFFPIANTVWFKHALLMLPYLCIGNIARLYIEQVNRYLPYLSIAGIIILFSEYMLCLPMPIHDYYIGISLKSAPVHIFNVFAGSFAILGISKKIGSCSVLQNIGQGTLLVYLLNECVVKTVIISFKPIYSNFYGPTLVIYHLVLFVICLLVFYILIRFIYGTKYLSWLVGKY